MNKDEINQLLRQLVTCLTELKIPVSQDINPCVKLNTRAKKRSGFCIYSEGAYTIEVSSSIVDNPRFLKEVMIHELLHTCPGCYNHGKLWKAYAAEVNQVLGCDIKRTVEVGDEIAGQQAYEEPGYILVCKRCRAQIERLRMSKVIKYPWCYRCKCGGKLRRVK